MATRQEGVSRATAIVAALRDAYSGQELRVKLEVEYQHAYVVALDARQRLGIEDEEWWARASVYADALDEEKQSA